MLVPPPYGKTELCPACALSRWLDASAIGEGAVFDGFERRRSPLRRPPALLVIGSDALTTRSIDRIVQDCAVAAGFADASSAAIAWNAASLVPASAGAHAGQLKRLRLHKSFDVLGNTLSRPT